MSAAPIHHKWQEIADLPADLEQFRDRELESLYQVWLDQRATLDTKAFSAELAREWSIETGIIEGVYALDRGTTEILIRRGIDSSYIARESTNREPELVARIIQTHEDVLEGLFDFVAQRRELSTSYIKELHAALLRGQDIVKGRDQFGTDVFVELKRGAYKEHPNNPTRRDKAVHEYCPPEHVASEMDRLVALHREHDQRAVPAMVEAAWLHHAFTQIHPFQDGNGRVARALASVVLIKGGFFPLVVHRDDWEKYIDALEAADDGDLAALVSLFGRLQKRDLTKAIVHAADATPVRSVDEAVAVTRDVFAGLGRLPDSRAVETATRASEMRQLAHARFGETALKLEHELGALGSRFAASSGVLGTESAPHVVMLTLRVGDANGAISLVFNANLDQGLVLVKAEFHSGASGGAFTTAYSEPVAELRPRFLKWLDDCIIRGLAEWRKTLV